jgi:hypothetical protein
MDGRVYQKGASLLVANCPLQQDNKRISLSSVQEELLTDQK